MPLILGLPVLFGSEIRTALVGGLVLLNLNGMRLRPGVLANAGYLPGDLHVGLIIPASLDCLCFLVRRGGLGPRPPPKRIWGGGGAPPPPGPPPYCKSSPEFGISLDEEKGDAKIAEYLDKES
jgi:hypothetical protein